MIYFFLWIYTLILTFVWIFFVILSIHAKKFSKFSTVIDRNLTFLFIFLLFLSISWYFIIIFWNFWEITNLFGSPNSASVEVPYSVNENINY